MGHFVFFVIAVMLLIFRLDAYVFPLSARRWTTATSMSKSEALANVRKAAEAFTQPESKDSAMKIVKQLEETDRANWGKHLELIDSCLLDEQPEACDNFEKAMTELRHLHEAAAGNG